MAAGLLVVGVGFRFSFGAGGMLEFLFHAPMLRVLSVLSALLKCIITSEHARAATSATATATVLRAVNS